MSNDKDNETLRLGDSTLLEIVALFHHGLMHGEDISDLLRSMELEVLDGKVVLSSSYERRYEQRS